MKIYNKTKINNQMKNLQNFTEFVTEGIIVEAKYYTLADMIEDAPESYEDEKDYIWDEIQKAMKIKNPKDLGFISSDDEGEPEYDIFVALEDKFNGPELKSIKDTGDFYYYDKKLNVVQHETQGLTAYFFNVKDAKKLLK